MLLCVEQNSSKLQLSILIFIVITIFRISFSGEN